MSLFGSLYTGVSGLSAQSRSLSMISDNIANVNTTAYKGAVAQFSSLVTKSSSTAFYRPGGVEITANYQVNSQGLIQSSASGTDVAIVGNGFFVVNDQIDGSGEQLYTRVGSFQPDFLGNFQTPSGYYLQGWRLDENEEVIDVNTIETVNTRSLNGIATPTSEVELGLNLDADTPAFTGAYAVGQLAAYINSDGTTGVQPSFSREIEVFDSLGRAHNVTLAVLKDPAANTWQMEMVGVTAEVEAASHPDGLISSGTITFDGNGALASINLTPTFGGTGTTTQIQWLQTDGANTSEIDFDFGDLGTSNGMTQVADESSVSYVLQNGAEVGDLSGIRIDADGYVIAGFSTGEQRKLYKLPISTFANPPGLVPQSGNVYSQSEASGQYNLRDAGTGSAGRLSPAALETANVDIADEFTKMIVTQRAYTANARVISTSDQMLEEVIRIVQ